MNFTAWLDVAIGLSVVYLGASLFVTIVHEYIQHLLNSRGNNLAKNLSQLIDDPKVRAQLKQSPTLAPFFEESSDWLKLFRKAFRGMPSYVDPVLVARLLLAPPATGAASPQETSSDKTSQFQRQLEAIVKTTSDDVEACVIATSEWIDRSLSVLAEGYKRRMRWLGFVIGLGVAFGFNIDTLALTTHLYRDKEARDAAAALAERVTHATDEKLFDECLALDRAKRAEAKKCEPLMGLADAVTSRNTSLAQLPIGKPRSLTWLTGLGWMLTALALSLGAPFWFDFLSRFINVRHGMRKPKAEPKDAKA